MKRYAVSMDIETLGLGIFAPVIQVGMVVFDIFEDGYIADTEFLVMHKHWEHVEPYAMSMHPHLLRAIAMNGNLNRVTYSPTDKEYDEAHTPEYLRILLQRIVPFDRVSETILNFFECHLPGFETGDEVSVAGKNFGSFDLPKLQRLPDWGNGFRIKHRFMDPGNLFWSPWDDGVELPDTNLAGARANVETADAHTALDDAFEVAKMVQEHVRLCKHKSN